jgi:hypothetical protein
MCKKFDLLILEVSPPEQDPDTRGTNFLSTQKNGIYGGTKPYWTLIHST